MRPLRSERGRGFKRGVGKGLPIIAIIAGFWTVCRAIWCAHHIECIAAAMGHFLVEPRRLQSLRIQRQRAVHGTPGVRTKMNLKNSYFLWTSFVLYPLYTHAMLSTSTTKFTLGCFLQILAFIFWPNEVSINAFIKFTTPSYELRSLHSLSQNSYPKEYYDFSFLT